MNRLTFAATALSLAASFAGCMTHMRDDQDAAPAITDAWFAPDHPCNTHDTFCGGPPDAHTVTACDDQDARGEGACAAVLGYVWRSGNCWPISGCSCVGANCDALATTAEACLEAHRECTRICGGFAELDACLPHEFCDYPDGSFCGGDDSTGVCTSRPSDCPDPGGVPVCGCDGNEYLADCSAYLAGTDVRDFGPCVTTHAYDTARADRDCGPADGPAWRITLTTDRTSCDVEPTDGSIVLSVWHALESDAAGTVYELREDFASDGQAMICGRPGDPCTPATGTFSFSVFAPGEVARFTFDVRTADGRRFAERDVEIARWWCSLTGPGCG